MPCARHLFPYCGGCHSCHGRSCLKSLTFEIWTCIIHCSKQPATVAPTESIARRALLDPSWLRPKTEAPAGAGGGEGTGAGASISGRTLPTDAKPIPVTVGAKPWRREGCVAYNSLSCDHVAATTAGEYSVQRRRTGSWSDGWEHAGFLHVSWSGHDWRRASSVNAADPCARSASRHTTRPMPWCKAVSRSRGG
jgi:hypothetical protein